MKNLAFLLTACLALAPAAAFSEAIPGEAAPLFSAKDAMGKDQKLADYKGKWVVLEWFNKDCPFVKKHYSSKNMQKLQETYTAKGVVWLTVNSSAKGKQGFVDNKQALADAKDRGASPTAIILDSDGSIGKSYGAKTTPHMFVVDPQQKIVYAGAIDDKESTNPKDVPDAKNYVSAALDAGMNGKPIATAISKPYGCGVKYN